MKTNLPNHLASVIILLVAMSCSSKTVEEVRIRPVKYEEISLRGGLQKRTFTGTAQSGTETNLSFRLSGLITMLDADVGDRVQKGKLLGRLDMKDVELTYQKAKANVQSTQIEMQNTKSDLERTKELYQSQSASLDDYEDAKTAFANAQTSYETAVKELGLTESEFEYSRIRAPLTGVISSVESEVNEYINAGQTIVVMDAEDANIEISVGVPESFISMITNGQKAEVEINDNVITGSVTEVGYSSSGAGVYPVVIKLDENNSNLRPGMPASATLTFGSADTEPVLTVPVYAVGEDEKGNYVFALKGTDDPEVFLATKQTIEVGELTTNGFKIVNGLTQGEKIAAAGLHILLDGQKVKLLN
ncbi:MAG: efflux RND transporter periplasmic adaptor subunit [Bacteroidota bacterium]